ncbi:conserved domain protein [Megasphaera sp. UPII 135-E]|uniref:Uncharacterized protein n=1 Tax=Megasphaera hutchinsoni TaxID=1588748 RepID=A0A134CD86_9FIRM|nr:conserved domain protein [Megasphaera sp. UPII 135-E]KXB90084.1 hypothetical protein HMPREF3182_01396 [Megasphaera hutchinsoni]
MERCVSCISCLACLPSHEDIPTFFNTMCKRLLLPLYAVMH